PAWAGDDEGRAALKPPVLVLGHEHPLDLGDELAQVEGLGEDLGVGRLAPGLQRHRGEAGDEHDADSGLDLAGLLGELDPVHLGHDDVAQEQVEARRLEQRHGVGPAVDRDRDEREIDPASVAPPLPSSGLVQSARTRGGIGLVPSRIVGLGPIWRERLARSELDRRIAQIHRPWHEALDAALVHARNRFGGAILLDCHSMPPRPPQQGVNAAPNATVIFGDRHGATIGADLLDAAVEAARALGYRTACNAPYAGGYTVSRHGRPERSIHALQIELDRSLYLARDLRGPGPGFEGVCRLIAAVAGALEARLLGGLEAIAAE